MSFTHLHVHSHYSLLDGLPKIKDLVKTAKDRGFKALALTDHGNMFGAIEFYQACKKEGINPIIGCEIYVAPASRFDKDKENRYHHLILLAENYTGYRNLMKLVSLGYLEGFYYRPRVDKELLKQYSEGLIASSACFAGEIPSLVRAGKKEEAKKSALEYNEIFGQDNFYLELMDLPALEGQMEMNENLIELSKETGIPLIVSRDVHYLNPQDAEAQDILTCIRDGRQLEEPNRYSMQGVDYSLAKGEEIASRFKHVPEAIANTEKIGERVNIEIELNQWHFPLIEIPAGKTADEHLYDEVFDKLSKLMKVDDEVKERAEYELDIIKTKGYSPYFLAVADYVGYARDHGIVETTRGSGAGSIVSYALGITTVNPLTFKLPFERFLNPYRPSPPDIDTDFADDRRDEVIEYVTKKYGEDKVAQIITFGTMMARGSVRDVGRALGYSYGFCDAVAKTIPFGAQGFNMTIAKALDLEPDLKKRYSEDEQVKRLLDLAQKIEGCARHTSIHAAGVVIAPTSLTDFTPVRFDTDKGKLTTQYEMKSVEAAGVLKMDFLGIRNLSILGHAVEIVEKTMGEKIDIYNLPWDDKKTYDMLARGETMGVFQLASSGMTRYLKELKPSNLEDIMAMIALFRPGPMAIIPEYIARKHGKSPITYYHPKMENFLDKSYGLLVYQDDLLLTAIELAGYTWKTVDKFRKAIGKKIPEEMARQHEIFVEGCQTHSGISKLKAEVIWGLFEPFQGYGFNKAHACSYGVVSYQTAYMKANYPIHYMTAILIAESGDMDKVPAIIHECGKMGIRVLPPDVNESFKNFAMTPAPETDVETLEDIKDITKDNTVVRFGLNAIKNVGENIAEVVYRERKENGKYESLEDFLSRVKDKDLNKKSLESLIKCGALDSFGIDRGVLLANIENILGFLHQTHSEANSNQNSLFAGTQIDLGSKVRIEGGQLASREDKQQWERELLGLYVSSHPFKEIQEKLESVLVPLNELQKQERNKWVVVGGIIAKAKKKITRSGKAMMFVMISDLTDNLELLVFPKVYEQTKAVWEEGKPVVVLGRTSEEEGDDKLFAEKVYEVSEKTASVLAAQLSVNYGEPSVRDYAPDLSVQLPAERVEIILNKTEGKEKIEKIKKLLAEAEGDIPVFIKAGEKTIKTSYKINLDNGLVDELVGLVGEESLKIVKIN